MAVCSGRQQLAVGLYLGQKYGIRTSTHIKKPVLKVTLILVYLLIPFMSGKLSSLTVSECPFITLFPAMVLIFWFFGCLCCKFVLPSLLLDLLPTCMHRHTYTYIPLTHHTTVSCLIQVSISILLIFSGWTKCPCFSLVVFRQTWIKYQVISSWIESSAPTY